MTREQRSNLIKQRLYSQGMTVKKWALANGYPATEVYKVLSGERKGLYGRSFEIAQKLGILGYSKLGGVQCRSFIQHSNCLIWICQVCQKQKSRFLLK